MIFLAGGDSFIYGSELKDNIPGTFGDNIITTSSASMSQSTFTALLSRDLGMDYCCVAYPGYSNSSIRRTIMNACEKTQNIGLVFVTWSFPCRYEFRFNYNTKERGGNWYNINPWSTIDNIEEIKRQFHNDDLAILQHHTIHLEKAKSLGITDFAKSYYANCGSNEYWAAYSSLLEVVMLQQYLKLKQIPYIFSLVDECLLNNSKKHRDENMQTLVKQLNMDEWVLFSKNRGFYTWAKDERYPFGTTHPLELAHEDAYKHIKENYHELVTKNL